MDIAIIGANGDVGRALAVQIVSRQLLTPRQRLQLVGRAGGSSAQALYGLRADLYDAFAEITPEIDVALTPDEVAADLILFTAGHTAPVRTTQIVDRRSLARANHQIFEEYAQAIRRNGHGEELVIIVTNPVELGVEVFARYLGPHRVIGMGAFQDTMRLRREIANTFGVRRQRVQAYLLGEHGDALVPVLSGMWIYGFDAAEVAVARQQLLAAVPTASFATRLAEEKAKLGGWLAEGEVDIAFRYASTLPAPLRAVLFPLITHISGAKTAISTAAVTTELVELMLSGGQSVIPLQVQLAAKDWDGPPGVLGVPVICGLRGWSRVAELSLDDEERDCLLDAQASIAARLDDWGRA